MTSALLALLLPAVPATAATLPAPTVYGGSGAADLYPGGLETTAEGGIVVADTAENRVRKYAADGTVVWSVGTFGTGIGQFNNPRDVGIDSDGNVYVADTANTRIVKLGATGNWLGTWRGPDADRIGTPMGLSVTGDLIYVADAQKRRIRVFQTSGTQVRAFGSNGDCALSPLRDVDADSDGNIYVANYTSQNILKFSATGSCLTRWGSAGNGQGQFRAPYGVRLAVDPVRNEELVYVADSNNNRVQVFTRTGSFVATFGQTGSHGQPGTFTTLRRVAVAGNGDVWSADLWGWRIVRHRRTSTGWVYDQQIGETTPQLTDTAVFNEARGIGFAADGSVHVADTVHHRIVHMSPQGAVLGSCGERGHAAGRFNWPRGVDVDRVTGDLWVADTKQSRLQVLTSACTNPQILGGRGTGPAQFNWPMSIAIRQSDRTAWVADTKNHRVVVWDVASRTPVAAFGSRGSGPGQFIEPRGIAVDPGSGRIYVADRGNNRIVELAHSGGAVSFVRAITGGLARPDGVAVGADHRIYAADTLNNRMVVFASDGSVLEATSGSPGMDNPSAAAVAPDGRIFLADTMADRLLVYGETSGGSDETQPTSTISEPETGASLPSEPVGIAGSAQDDVGVANVGIAIRDTATGRWWSSATSAWVTTRTYNAAPVDSPGTVSTEWELIWNEPTAGGGGSYEATSRATDTSGNTEVPAAAVAFTVAGGPGSDTTEPDTAITSPGPREEVSAPVGMTGSATDDRGVAAVHVAVRDAVTGQWWNGQTQSWVATSRWNAASLADPDTSATGWTYVFEHTGGSGQYWATSRGTDTSENIETNRSGHRFTVTAGGDEADTADPVTAITYPGARQEVGAPVAMAGTAADDVGVAAVDIAVRDPVTGQWWNGATQAWVASTRWNAATLSDANAADTEWSYVFAAPASGDYWITSRGTDTSGKIETDRSGHRFTVMESTVATPTYVGDLAGPGYADLTPVDIAVHGDRYYAIDVARYRVVAIDRASGAELFDVGGTRGDDTGDLGAARAIAVDGAGNVYIADTANARITKYDANLSYLTHWGAKGSADGQFDQVYGVAIGTGVGAGGVATELLYTVDGDGRVTKFGLDGTLIGRFATGVALLQPRMAEVHPDTRDLWVVNARDRQIVVIDEQGTERFRFGGAGSGPGEFKGDPRGIAIAADGATVFVSDKGNARVQAFTADGTYLASYGGPGDQPHHLSDPRGVEVVGGMLLVTDQWDHSLKEYAADGSLSRRLFGTQAPVGGVNTPRGLDVDASGRLYASDWWNQRIGRWNADGSAPVAWGARGTREEPGSINFAWDVAVQPGTGRVFVTNRESHEIEVFSGDGDYVTRWGIRGAAPGQFEFPHGAAFAPDGTLVVSDSGNGRLQRFSVDTAGNGTLLAVYGSPGSADGQLNIPTGVAVEDDGTIWVADTRNNRIQKRHPSTGAWTAYGGPAGGAPFRVPWGVTVAPDGTIWVADSGNHRIVQTDTTMEPIFVADGVSLGAGPLNFPYDVAFGTGGRIYVSDAFGNRIIILE